MSVTWFVTRHDGARDWAARRGLSAVMVDDLNKATLKPGDRVMGSLPVHLAAQICAAGARYFHLVLHLPPEQRGRELSADEILSHVQTAYDTRDKASCMFKALSRSPETDEQRTYVRNFVKYRQGL